MPDSTTAEQTLSSTTPRPEVLDAYEVHPVAGLWPLLSPADIQDMALDIKKHGQREPVWTYNQQILDGRNRIVACDMAGVKPLFEEWKPARPGDTPITFIMSKNLHRRHLSASVRAAVGVTIEEWIRDENQRVRDEQAKIAATFSTPTTTQPLPGPTRPVTKQGAVSADFTAPATPASPPSAPVAPAGRPSAPNTTPTFSGAGTGPTQGGRVRDQVAKAVGVSSGYLADAKDMQKASPEMFKRVAAGEVTLPKAQEELVQQAREKGALEQVGLRPGSVRAAVDRIDARERKRGRVAPRITIEKFSKVQTSRVLVTIEATFGSAEKAENWLNMMQDEKSVLNLKYEVEPAPTPGKKSPKKD